MIISQYVVSEAQWTKNILMSKKSHVPFLRYSVFCISYHFTNFEIWDAWMSISTMTQMEQEALYENSGSAKVFFKNFAQ